MWRGECRHSIRVYLYRKIYATLKILSVYLCVYRYMSMYISFLLFTVQKKPQSSSLQKKSYSFQAIHHLFSVCSIHNYQRASPINIRHIYLPVSSVVTSSGQQVLFPARKILRWTSSSRRKSISLSTWALQLSMISREFMWGHQSPLGLLCTMRFIIVILGW